MGERLQKHLAAAGLGSRRACEELIRAGRVKVNGAVALLGASVEAGDAVLLDDRPIGPREARVVILFYKPRGVICTSHDPEGRKTVRAYFRSVPERLYHVGRLDVNSEGLLIMTNDGALAYRMTHPKFEQEKTYYAVCDGVLSQEEAEHLEQGVLLEDGPTAPARVQHIRPTRTGATSFTITIHEGRNRQVRRMLEAVGHKTLLLRRERFGPLALGSIAPGEWRYATPEELRLLETMLTDKD